MRAERAASFARVADAYERARPGYPADAVIWLAGETPCDVVGLGRRNRKAHALARRARSPRRGGGAARRDARPAAYRRPRRDRRRRLRGRRCRCPMHQPTSSCARRRSTGSTRSPPSRRSRASSGPAGTWPAPSGTCVTSASHGSPSLSDAMVGTDRRSSEAPQHDPSGAASTARSSARPSSTPRRSTARRCAKPGALSRQSARSSPSRSAPSSAGSTRSSTRTRATGC